MQSGKKDDIEKPDLFSLEVGKRMREHRMEVDPEIWEALEVNFPLAKNESYHIGLGLPLQW